MQFSVYNLFYTIRIKCCTTVVFGTKLTDLLNNSRMQKTAEYFVQEGNSLLCVSTGCQK